MFRIVIPLNDEYFGESATQSADQTTQSADQTTQSPDQAAQAVMEAIMALIVREPNLSQKQIADRLELNLNTVKYHIRKQREQGRLERNGTNRKGRWIVVEGGTKWQRS